MATLTKLRWNKEGGRLFFLCLRPLSQQYTEGKLLISKVKLFFEQDLKSVVRLQANARVCQVRYNLAPLVWSSTYCFISYFEVFLGDPLCNCSPLKSRIIINGESLKSDDVDAPARKVANKNNSKQLLNSKSPMVQHHILNGN